MTGADEDVMSACEADTHMAAAQATNAVEEVKPGACFNCCSLGGGHFKAFEGETKWHIGLTQDGQAHYACAECAPLLFDVRPL